MGTRPGGTETRHTFDTECILRRAVEHRVDGIDGKAHHRRRGPYLALSVGQRVVVRVMGVDVEHGLALLDVDSLESTLKRAG